MSVRLSRYWFLLLLLAGLSLAAARPEWLRPWVNWLEPRLMVGTALFLMAWGLESRRLLDALLRPWAALWALLISYGLLPVLAWVAGGLLPEADLRLGLMIAASVPCTLASAVLWTRLAGGDEATALLAVLLTTCTSWLATTAWLALTTGAAAALDTTDLMTGLLGVLVLPVGLGQLGRARAPLRQAAERFKPIGGVLSRLLIFSIILRAAVDVSAKLAEKAATLTLPALFTVAVLCLGAHLAALGTGFWTGRWWGLERPQRIAVAFACSQKTLPVALFVFDRYFKEAYPLAVVPLVFYHVGQLVVDTFIAEGLAGKPSGETGPLPEPAG